MKNEDLMDKGIYNPEEIPVVTFVMPAYNVEKYIGDAITSIQNQTVPHWKLIIVNDGSSDNTLQTATDFQLKDNRIKVISMGSPSGSAYQPRKKGILEADTELVAPLDADDYIEADYLKKLLDKQNETDSDAVYPTMICEKDGEVITPKDNSLFTDFKVGRDCVAYTLDGWKINCNGGIIRKKLYEETFDKYDSSLTYSCADELLTRQLLFMAPKVSFSEAKYFYRDNPTSITRKKSLKLFDFLINNITLTEFTETNFEKGSPTNIFAQKQNFHGVFDALRLLNKFEFSPEEEKNVLSLIDRSARKVDLAFLKPYVSQKYMWLFKGGLNFSRNFLKFSDKFTKS